MSQIVLDAIAASLAELVREVPTPTGDLFYGRDLSCTSDLTENLDEVDEQAPIGIAQGVIRRLTTARGGLPDDPDYGLDVRRYCNRGTPVNELRDLGGQIRAEISKDDRIADARVTVTTPSPAELAITIVFVPEDPALAPFTAILAATSADVLMEAIQ